MYDFLRRLVMDSGARAAFDADPRRCLDEAGFTDLPVPELVHAASFLLDSPRSMSWTRVCKHWGRG
ncbi:hypothetical protein BJF85_04280 [Saccharomonospora sp. CUA-673]|nr:hypothetical protein BJF85_04280 [Saccharomonospora sp. CUA-673]